MKKFQFLTLCIALIIFSRISAQGISGQMDSLQEQLLKTIPDTTRVKVLDKLAYNYSKLDADKGLKFAKEAELLSLKINWKKGLAMAYSGFGINYTAKCDYKKAYYNYLRAMDIFRETGNTTACGGVLANMSVMYLNQSDYANAMEYSFNALKLLEEGTDLKTIAAVQENIGSIYLEQRDFAKTLHYFSLAYANNEKLNDKAAMARNMANKGIVLNEQGEYSEALKCHEFALKTNLQRGSKKSIQINLANIGNTYCHLKNYQKALSYHLKALAISQELKDKRSTGINMGNAGEVYLLLSKHNTSRREAAKYLGQSIRFLKEAVLICREINFKGPHAEFNQYYQKHTSLMAIT